MKVSPIAAAFALIVLGVMEVAAASAQTMAGPTHVIDGDTIDLAGHRVRLHGIDAPEASQTCDKGNVPVHCGAQATEALQGKIAGRVVVCNVRSYDRNDRAVAICTVDGADLAAWLVEQGYAVAYTRYSTDYVRQEAMARRRGAGVWGTNFVMPWDYRRAHADSAIAMSAEAVPGAPPGCVIKGNIGSEGDKIYHTPGQRFYDKTAIEPSKGERWFCSEADARAAGWRPAQR